MYILNSYNGYIWYFTEYLLEYYRRDKITELWQIYVAKCVSAGIEKIPDYCKLLDKAKGVNIEKNSEKEIDDLINEINNKAGANNELI